jgi:hypothetical protein
MARHQLWAFFLLTFAISWAIWLGLAWDHVCRVNAANKCSSAA